MFQVLFLSLFLLYFWYFYHFHSKPVPRPATPAPPKPVPFEPLFLVPKHNTFRFLLNGKKVWEHPFKTDSYLVQSHTEKIIERDDCYHYAIRTRIPATGLGLYTYLKKHPDYHKAISFEENSAYTAQQGHVFYFTCFDRRIEALDMCPSGKIYQNQLCVDISSCTGQPDFTHLPVHADPSQYIECKNGREFKKTCPPDTFFYHDQCVRKDDLTHQCKWRDTVLPFKLDAKTLFECRHHKPVYTTCLPGTQLFDNPFCEPDVCLGQPDGTAIGLPKRTLGPFTFVPGYQECLHDKVFRTVECPASWDPMLSQEDNLTHLPMVFDGQKCTVPSFCANVTSDDPDVLVPLHEFTKYVQNWKQSPFYDQTVGFTCTPIGRKRKQLEPGKRIGKKFKVESACDALGPPLLPIYGQPSHFYNCITQQTVPCPSNHFFTGWMCKEEPEHAFKYQQIPLFLFKGLNDEAWIPPWDYLPHTVPRLRGCHTSEYTHLKLYNICAHHDCMPYAFLALVPDLTLFLPVSQKAKCRFDVQDRHLKREPTTLNYTFWEQKILPDDVQQAESCTVGQKLKTGHFVWDTTVYATCDPTQPFLFCPSPYTDRLEQTNNEYACAPPVGNTYLHTKVHRWTSFATNEVKRLLPPVWDPPPYSFRLNKADPTDYVLPQTGFDVPHKTRLNLRANRTLDLELQYRVTYPPHVVFQYDQQNHRHLVEGDPYKGFMVRLESFVETALNFPTYGQDDYVNGFQKEYHP